MKRIYQLNDWKNGNKKDNKTVPKKYLLILSQSKEAKLKKKKNNMKYFFFLFSNFKICFK